MEKFIKLSINSKWLLAHRSDSVLPVDVLISELKNRLGQGSIVIISKRFDECNIVVKVDREGQNIEELAADILHRAIGEDNWKDFATLSLSDKPDETVAEQYRKMTGNNSEATDNKPASDKEETAGSDNAVKGTEENKSEADKPGASDKAEEKDAGNSINSFLKAVGKAGAGQETKAPECTASKELEELIGADEFKSLCSELIKASEYAKLHGLIDSIISRVYLFSLDDGNGMTTYLRILAKLLNEQGLVTIDCENGIREVQLGKKKENFEILYNVMKPNFTGSGLLISIDIAEYMNSESADELKGFIQFIASKRTNNTVVVFRIPYVERELLKLLTAQVNDIMFVRPVQIAPFTIEELMDYARRLVQSKELSMDDRAEELLEQRIVEEKADGRFYGVKTVKKVVDEMLYRKAAASLDNDNVIISADELIGFIGSDLNRNFGLEMLDNMVGMEAIKEQLLTIVNQIKLSMRTEGLERPCVHMRFIGNPGTGKTTVARILGNILKEAGILRKGNFFEHKGRDLCGRYVGETSPKTSAICRDAYGSVLFIDEAYSLFRSDGLGHADYGTEAIDTLIAEMENHRTDLLVIMAGYPEEMKTMLSANPGLESRLPYTINFPNYNQEQLLEIFMGLVKKSFKYDEDFAKAAEEYFMALPKQFVEDKSFSNARFVRNLYERVWGKASMRVSMGSGSEICLCREDFMKAAAEKEFAARADETKKIPLGFQ